MPQINCKVELQLKLTKHCVNVNDNVDVDVNNIIFTIKDRSICPSSNLTSKIQ